MILFRIEKRPVLVLIAASLIRIPLMPMELWLVKSLVDHIQMWRSPDSVSSLLLIAAWLSALMVVSNIALGVPIPMAMTRLIEIGTHEEQRLLMQKNSTLPLTTIESPAIKDLYERASKVSFYEIYNTGIQMLQSTLQTLTLISLMLVYGQWLPVLVVSAAALLLSHVSGKSTERIERTDRKQTSNRRLKKHYGDLMTKRYAAKELRLFGLHPLLANRWTFLHKQQSRETLQAVRTSEFRKLVPEMLMALFSGLLIAIIVFLPSAQKLTAGDFSLLFMVLTMMLSQLTGLISQGTAMRTQYMRWEDFSAYMKLVEYQYSLSSHLSQVDAITNIPSTKSLKGLDLKVHNVSFLYPGTEKPAIHEVSFFIPSGCRAALVGHNGSGKSTLVKLLTGLYMPHEGEIVWQYKDGKRLKDAKQDHISAVFQDFTRLAITLRENVAIGALSQLRSDNRLREALHSVGARFNDLNVQIGADFGGIEPSGGEWQKIVTARALLRDAEFVFFDEPTAALDPAAEKLAFDLFLQVTKGRSALLVTHRLGAAKLADIIFVIKDGTLVEQGTHDKLMKQEGEYWQMFELQASWYR